MTMALEDDLDVAQCNADWVFVKREKPGNPSPPIAFAQPRINRPGLVADGAFFPPLDSLVWMGVYRRDVIVKNNIKFIPDYIIRILSGQQNLCLTRYVAIYRAIVI